MSDLVFKDKAGNEIRKGDLIVYGHALGRCAGMRYGKVLEIKLGKDITTYKDVMIPKLTVQGVDDDWSHNEPSLIKKSTINFGSRILKLKKDQISPKVLALLEKVEVGETN